MKTMNLVEYNDTLTNQAYNIFGDDLVSKAYLCYTFSYNEHFVDGISASVSYQKQLKDFSEKYTSESSTEIFLNDIISADFSIMIEFINGKKIIFWGSEWGGIQQA